MKLRKKKSAFFSLTPSIRGSINIISGNCKRCFVFLRTTLGTETKRLALGFFSPFKHEIKSLISVFWSSQYNLVGHKVTVFIGEGKLKKCLWFQKQVLNEQWYYVLLGSIYLIFHYLQSEVRKQYLAGVSQMIYLLFSLVKNH